MKQPEQEHKHSIKDFFQGLSFSQLLAGALAAVTSFFLSSKIGIAGSVIGVAVASIVSTAASQIYKNVIDASSEKIQTTVVNGELIKTKSKSASADDDDTDELSTESSEQNTKPEDATTEQIDTVEDDGEHIGRTVTSRAGSVTGKKQLPADSPHHNRVAIIIAIVSALVAVAATAAIILVLTDGKGTDVVVHDKPTTSQIEPSHDSTDPSYLNTMDPSMMPSDSSSSDDSSASPSDSTSSQNPTQSASPSPSESSSDASTEPAPSPSSSSPSPSADSTDSTGTPDTMNDEEIVVPNSDSTTKAKTGQE